MYILNNKDDPLNPASPAGMSRRGDPDDAQRLVQNTPDNPVSLRGREGADRAAHVNRFLLREDSEICVRNRPHECEASIASSVIRNDTDGGGETDNSPHSFRVQNDEQY